MGTIISRRTFLLSTSAAALAGCPVVPVPKGPGPNVLFIITDDQGYADVGCHGNPVLLTPNLDALCAESTRFTHFRMMPACSPTRACLMTGRYNYRTGVVDINQGRSMMYPGETTMAEILRAGGYRTGIFGKWHLGDNFPLRAMDQGFSESLVFRGSGLSHYSDPTESGYFDPVLLENGEPQQFEGYCTDIFTSAAIDFIAESNQPFFCYLSLNAPHLPLEIDDRYAEPYRQAGLEENIALFFGMIANIDENIGRLLAKLDELGLHDRTLVIFTTDNGGETASDFYNAGMRGVKGTVYEGGIRAPFFMRLPGVLPAATDVNALAGHVDVLPTVAALCDVELNNSTFVDGINLKPLIDGEPADDRYLFFQWHRSSKPEAFVNCAVVSSRYKLVDGEELYDLELDPGETDDIAESHPDLVQEMREAYIHWFEDVGSTRGFTPPYIVLGSDHENPSTLTRQDWRGAANWYDQSVGYWVVNISRSGTYRITGEFAAIDHNSVAKLAVAGEEREAAVPAGSESTTYNLKLTSTGPTQLKMWLETDGGSRGMRFVYVERI